MHARKGWLAVVALAAMFFVSDSWAVCYVNQNATGKNDGTTWDDAYIHPQLALLNGCAEIWVAKGVYTPTLIGNDPTISFDIPAGTKIYGGFSGGESSVDQRLPSINQTVLSGDVDHNDHDSGDWMIRTDNDIKGGNSYHVVVMRAESARPITNDTILDGFLIVGGDTPSEAEAKNGAALYCYFADDSAECSPTLNNLFFVGNRAYNLGGAVALEGSIVRPLILNSVFRQNYSATGGAVRLSSSVNASAALISGCAFFNNEVLYYGGAVSLDGAANVKVSNSTFSNNTAGGGGAISIWSHATLTISSATFAGNTASDGGAIFSDHIGASGSGIIVVTNSIFWGNKADGDGPDFSNYYPDIAYEFVAKSILEHGCPSDLSVCIDVSSDDPKLSSPADHGGSTLTLIPGVNGSAVDQGDDATCPSVDQRGIFRPQGAHCDMGAVEWRPLDDVIFRNGFQ